MGRDTRPTIRRENKKKISSLTQWFYFAILPPVMGVTLNLNKALFFPFFFSIFPIITELEIVLINTMPPAVCLTLNMSDSHRQWALLTSLPMVQEPKEKRRGSPSFSSRVWQPCRSKYIFIVYAHGRKLCSYCFWHGSTAISYPQCSLTFMREHSSHRCHEQSFAIRSYAMSADGIDVVWVHKLFA